MASTNSVSSSIPMNVMERQFREEFSADLRRRRDNIMSCKLECTVCNINIKHRLVTSRNEHVILGVLLCNSCSHRIRLNVNQHMEANRKNWCRWCANEFTCKNGVNNLVTCTACTGKFCQTCVRKHWPRERRSDAWMCFACNPSQQWYKLRALCGETLRYTEEMRRDLDERRRRMPLSSTAARRARAAANATLHVSPRVMTTNISTSRTPGGQSNVSATVTVSTSPTMMTANVSVSLHHSASPNLLDRSFLTTSRFATSLLTVPLENTNMNRSLDTSKSDEETCVICMSEEPRLACVPCGHLCMCETCWPQFEPKFLRCPICRQIVQSTIRIYHGRN